VKRGKGKKYTARGHKTHRRTKKLKKEFLRALPLHKILSLKTI